MFERLIAKLMRAKLFIGKSFIKGFALIVLYFLAGELIAETLFAAIRFPMPGSVVGMVLLTASLRLGLVKADALKPPSQLLLRYMSLFFVPPAVGLMLYFELLGKEWLPVLIACVVSTTAVLLVVGVTEQKLEQHD